MPGSLYSDLAKIYEKAVQFPAGGSITIIAVSYTHLDVYKRQALALGGDEGRDKLR